MNVPADGSTVFVDACCWINLLATRRAEEILTAVPCQWACATLVADEEVIYAANTDATESRPLRDLEARGSVRIEAIRSEEEESLFVRFAAQLDDGEASTCALALARGAAVATDDRKALRLLSQWAPETSTLQTAQVLERWAYAASPLPAILSDVLLRIEREARFAPRPNTPSAEWWARNRGEGGF